MSIKTQHAVKAYLLFVVFIIILPKNTKYRYKILKKDQARGPKEANKACVQDHLLKLCYLTNNYNLQLIFWAGESSFMFILLQPPSLWRFREQKHSRTRRKLLHCRLIETLSNQDKTSFLPSQRRSFSFSYFVDHNEILLFAKFQHSDCPRLHPRLPGVLKFSKFFSTLRSQ